MALHSEGLRKELSDEPPTGVARAWIARAAGIRPGEERLVGWIAALFAVTQAGHGLGATTADTLFLLRFGVEYLPVMILASGAVVMAASIVHTAGISRFGAARWLAPVLLALGGWVALERIGVSADAPGIYPVIWVGAQVAILVSYTVVWNAAGEACNTRQAKRLYPIFASAGIGGAIVGNGLAGPLASNLGTENLLWIHAGLLATGAGVMTAFVRPLLKTSHPGRGVSVVRDLRAGLELTRQTPLLRLLAWLAVLLSILFFLVVFAFNEAVATGFRTEAELAGFLGVFSAIATALTFAVSMFGASRLFRRFGVVATLLILPAVYAIGFGLWLVSFGLVTATLIRGAQWIAVNALGGTAWNSLFNVIPGRRRSQVMAFNTAIPTQLGTMAAGGLLMISSSAGSGTTGIGFLLAALAVILVVRMRRAYGDALIQAVHGGLVEVFDAPIQGIQKPTFDADTLKALSTALADPSAGARAAAAAMLGRLEPDAAAPLVAAAMADEAPRVRAAALHAMSDRPDSVQLARRLITDPSPDVRRRAVLTLERHHAGLEMSSVALADSDPVVRASAALLCDAVSGRRVIEAMLASSEPDALVAALDAIARRPTVTDADLATFVSHPDRRVRAAAARSLIGRLDRAGVLVQMLDDPSILVRTAAAETLAADTGTLETLIGVLANGTVRACEAALQALAARGLGGDRCKSWIAGEVARAQYLKFHGMVLRTRSANETRNYLVRLLRAREQRLERWAIMALTVPATEAIMPVLRRGIWSTDPETTAQALEALDSISERSLVSDLISLLEDDPIPPTHDATASLVELSNDRDEWIRTLSVVCLIEDGYPHLMELVARLVQDRSRLVKTVLARLVEPVHGPGAFDTIDRVMALQRVAIFAEIDPEDLERIAGVVAERRYQPDEVIYRFGAEGDEILVIISGEVEIRRPGREQIRSYGAGETVGELAFLRRRPRAADVIAGPSGVHALALAAAELEVILEERPTVAMAMLATLAERLGTS